MTTQTEKVVNRVEDFATGMKDSARQIKEEYLDGAWNRACDIVKDHPAKAILLAVGTGVVLGSLLRRK